MASSISHGEGKWWQLISVYLFGRGNYKILSGRSGDGGIITGLLGMLEEESNIDIRALIGTVEFRSE
jgi:hypothetical protein